METGILQQLALLGSIVMAASMLATALFGVWTYKRNAEAQVRNAEAQPQLLALGTLQHYLDLAIAHPDLASHADDQPIDARYGWFAAQALTTAQTLRALVRDQAD